MKQMGFEEIRAGLAKYIIKEHSSLINDGNDLFYVYAHYPTTEPDVMVMAFISRANAELFCEALNAENELREVDLVKHGKWMYIGKQHVHEFQAMNKCSVCKRAVYNVCYVDKVVYFNYCPHCGSKMDGDNNG